MVAWKAGALAKATCNLSANEGKQVKSCSEEAPRVSSHRREPAATDEGWLLLGKAGLG